MKRQRSAFGYNLETGWYVPGIEDPEVLALERDPESEVGDFSAARLYAILTEQMAAAEAPEASTSPAELRNTD